MNSIYDIFPFLKNSSTREIITDILFFLEETSEKMYTISTEVDVEDINHVALNAILLKTIDDLRDMGYITEGYVTFARAAVSYLPEELTPTANYVISVGVSPIFTMAFINSQLDELIQPLAVFGLAYRAAKQKGVTMEDLYRNFLG